MAFTMAQNSLFAILLRSSWVYSILIGIVLFVLSLLIADGKFLIVGITAAIPFTGIATYSAYKQYQRPSKQRILEVADLARGMPAQKVAEQIASTYQAHRYSSEPFKPEGAEMELTRGYRHLLVATKRLKAAKTGIETLKKLVAAGEKIEANGYLYVTLGEISASAVTYAKDNNIELIGAEALAALFDGKASID